MGQITDAAYARSRELFYYSPYNFVGDFTTEKQLKNCVYSNIAAFGSLTNNRIIPISLSGNMYHFLISYLPWDSDYFRIKTYKLCYVLFSNDDQKLLNEAVKLFLNELLSEKIYCFIEIPSEDTMLIQALNHNGFKLIETRLTYFRGNLNKLDYDRYPVRKATIDDSENLMLVAREMRNDYDRFHADPVFSPQIADEFLATYIDQSLKGLADVVLTPDEKGVPSDSFLTANYLKNEWERNGVKISKMVLSAVSAKTNKGWYKKLISEMTFHLREEGAEYIFMNTQSTNRAVIYTWESMGYRLGCTTHILSYNNIK